MFSSSPSDETYSTVQQEEFSYAFIGAIVSAAGYSLDPPTRLMDNAGIDIRVTAPGEVGTVSHPTFAAQVKSTSSSIVTKDQQINFPLLVKNYNHLIKTNFYFPHLLIVVLIPKERSGWVESTDEKTILQKAAYWISLKGREQTQNKTNITIHIPRENLLTPSSLQELMQRIADNNL